MNWKKLLALVTSLALCLSLCGTALATTEIEYWVSWTPGAGTDQALTELFAAYEQEHDVKINYSVATYDMLHDRLIAAGAAGNTPDLVWGLPEWVGEFSQMGLLADLTDVVNSWEEKDNIYPSVWDAMTVGGKIVGIPYEMTLRAFLVHDDINTEAGATVPDTWENLLEMTSYYETTGKYPYGITGAGVRMPQELLVYLAQKDLVICSAQEDGLYRNTWKDNPEELQKAAEVFQFYLDLIDQGVANPNSKTWGWEETDENFATGITAMFVSGNWLAEREGTEEYTAMSDVSIHPIPYPSDGHPATYVEAKPLFIFEGGENNEAAIELAKAMCSEEWQKAAFEPRSPRKDVSADTKWSKDFSPLAENGVVFPPVTLGGITQAMIDSLAMVLQEGQTPEAAAEWLSDAINDSLRDSGELSE